MCVRACVRACVRTCVRMYVCKCIVHACMQTPHLCGMQVHACIHIYTAWVQCMHVVYYMCMYMHMLCVHVFVSMVIYKRLKLVITVHS